MCRYGHNYLVAWQPDCKRGDIEWNFSDEPHAKSPVVSGYISESYFIRQDSIGFNIAISDLHRRLRVCGQISDSPANRQTGGYLEYGQIGTVIETGCGAMHDQRSADRRYSEH
jgi:hypothetical protein